TACLEPPSAVIDPPVNRVATPHAWAGGEALLSSPGFASLADPRLPTFALADSLLAVRRVDDTTLAVRLPQMNGTAQLEVAFAGAPIFIDPIQVHGFRGSRDAPALFGLPYVWPAPGSPWMIGNGAQGIVIVDVRDGSQRPFAGVVNRPWCL